MSKLRQIGILGVLVTLSTAAWADKEDAATLKARALFESGQKQFNLGQFPEALAAFKDAYLAKSTPGMLVYIGQCHGRMGHHAEAVYSYERFLELSPKASIRGEVERLLVKERDAIVRDGTPATPTAPASVEKEPPPPTKETPPEPPPVVATLPAVAAVVPPAESTRAIRAASNENESPATPAKSTSPLTSYSDADPTIRVSQSTVPVYKKPWLWVVLSGAALVVVGVAVGVAYAIPNNASVPSSMYTVPAGF